jgi:recombination protein RecA
VGRHVGKFDPELLSVIRGMVLGDGHLVRKADHYRLLLHHGPRQEAYIRHKRERLASITTGEVFRFATGALGFNTRSYPELTELHHQFYPDGKKCVTLDILDGLTPEAIAYWYMDDGNRSVIHRQLKLCTNGYTGAENELIRAWFYDRHDIWLRLYQDKAPTPRERASGVKQRLGDKGWFLTVLLPEVSKMERLIRPYVIPDMAYKLNPPGLSDSPNFAATRRGRRNDDPPVSLEELVGK